MKKKTKEVKKSALNMEEMDLPTLVRELSSYVKSTGAHVLAKDVPEQLRIGFETIDNDGKSILWNTRITNIRKQRDEVFSKEENDLMNEYHAKRAELNILEDKYIKIFTSK